MDERKRKLEELRNKKRQLKQLIKNTETTSTPPPTDPAKPDSSQRKDTTSSVSSSTTSNQTSLDSSLRPAKRNSFLEDPTKNKRLMEIHIRKVNETLKTSKSEHFLQGIYPDLKSEETQYKLPEEFEEKKKE